MNSRSEGVLIRLRLGAAAVLAAAVLLPLAAPGRAVAGPSSGLALSALELSTIQSINELRVAHGVAPLAVSPSLLRSAIFQCEQMVAGGYFAHTAPGGSTFAARLAAFYPPGRHRLYAVGENLLWSARPMSGPAMVASFMKSPEHRGNLLDPAWRQVAVAALHVPSAPGVWDDAPVTVVTVEFGVRH